MPKDKSASHAKIMAAAKAEFLEQGFEKASIRSIAARAGMTSAGLYRHFTDKEDMFAALVEPTLKICLDRFAVEKARDYELLEQNRIDEMWGKAPTIMALIDLIYANFDAFKLLVCRSEGTRYADFVHAFVMMEQQETLAYMEAARKNGIPVKEVDPKELHLLMSAYSAALFEIVVHDFSKAEAEHYIQTLLTFFVPGWRAVLGL